jgi:hypothetical protein
VPAVSLPGPALGGALVAITHTSTAAFGVDAASFAMSALSLALIPRGAASGSVTAGGTEPEAAGGSVSEAAGGAEPASGAEPEAADGVLALLRKSRFLQVIIVVLIAANLANGGMDGVALPALAHARFGAAGYGALLACFAAGALGGTLAAARTGSLRAPAMVASAVFLVEAVTISLTPYLGGEAGAAAAMFASGACNGLGNVIFLTVAQKWIPPGMLGRVMGVMMLCAFGTYPLSAAVAGVLVRHLGPAPFFPIAGGLIAVAILFGLTQREFREFGSVQAAEAASEPKAASGSRK